METLAIRRVLNDIRAPFGFSWFANCPIMIGREETTVKVTVEVDKCVASGQCVLAAAEVFDQRDDDGVVILLNDNPDSDQYEAVRLAAQMCPASVIHVAENEVAKG